MRAMRIAAYGGPEVLRLDEMPAPRPGEGEVVVQVGCAGINFMDVYTRLGRYAKAGEKSGHYQTGLPLTLGIEGAGRIVALGAGVTDWSIGDRVAWALARGSYAELAAVPARLLARVPDAVPLEVAAAAMFQGLTVHYLVEDVGRIGEAGRTSCLVHSAAGGIGQLLVQLAGQRGARVVATASTADKRAVAASRGAHAVSAPDPAAFVAACREATGGAGVDVVFDSIGRPAFEGNLQALRRRGLFVHYGANGGAIGPIDPMQLADSGSLYFVRPRLADHVADAATVARRAGEIFRLIADGALHVGISDRVGFEGVAEAHAALEERRAVGKTVLVVDPTVQ